jgi:hypothetical protein
VTTTDDPIDTMSTASSTTWGPLPQPPGPVPADNLPAVPVAPLLGDVPTVPAVGELQTLAQLARTFAMADLVPSALRDKPADCLLVLMTARDLGLSCTVAFREMHVIEGKVTCSPKLRKAIVAQRGLGRVWPAPVNDAESATWYAIRADMPDVTWTSTFTMDDARIVPAKERGSNITLDRKSNWKAYPKRMLSWRALGYLLDDAFSEVGTGLYSPDEMGAITDEDGQPVLDVTGVEALDGMANHQQQRQAQRAEAAATPADPEALWALQERMNALPPAVRSQLRDAWKAEESRVRGVPARLLPDRLLRTARAMVNAHWGEAVKAGADEATEVAALRQRLAEHLTGFLCGWAGGGTAPVVPQDDSPAPGHHGDPTQAQDGAPGPPSDDDGGTPEPDLEARARWRAVMAGLSGQVRAAAEAAATRGITEADVVALGDDIKAMHWSAVNAALTDAGLGDEYPPDSPIDLRRMAVCLILIDAAGRPDDAG